MVIELLSVIVIVQGIYMGDINWIYPIVKSSTSYRKPFGGRGTVTGRHFCVCIKVAASRYAERDSAICTAPDFHCAGVVF